MESEKMRDLICAASGRKKAETVFRNGKVFNVYTGEFEQIDVAVEQGMIAGIGEYEGESEVDLGGKYLVPGWIDSHLHLESTMVRPSELVRLVALAGTTTLIADPHEAANVAGLAGVEFLLSETANSPANVYMMAPSCVPASPVDENGAILDAKKLEKLCRDTRLLGLGEVMDCPAVMEAADEMLQKLLLFAGKPIDGHAPGLNGKELCAYLAAGIGTDHECSDWEDALLKYRCGMMILVRQGSAARNLAELVSGMVRDGVSARRFCFCTDDKHIEDIQREGHIGSNIREAVKLGLPVPEALRMASLYPAEYYGLRHLGAIAPGKQADFVVLSDLEEFRPAAVYHRGKLVEAGERQTAVVPPELLHTVKCRELSDADFTLSEEEQRFVLQMIPGQINTAGRKTKPGETGLLRIAVVERHGGSGRIGRGLADGFGLKHGAAATSISHDSHNLIVIGDNSRDMALAANRVREMQGGCVLAADGRVCGELALPLMGLMSCDGYETVHRGMEELKKQARRMGVPAEMDPFITLSFMALPVIPEFRITTQGMYDVTEKNFCKNCREK